MMSARKGRRCALKLCKAWNARLTLSGSSPFNLGAVSHIWLDERILELRLQYKTCHAQLGEHPIVAPAGGKASDMLWKGNPLGILSNASLVQALPPPPMPFQPKKDRDKPPEPKPKEGSSKKGKEPAAAEKPRVKTSPSKAK